jgi:hypothetical protein
VLGFCFPVFGQFPAFEHRRLRELGTGSPCRRHAGAAGPEDRPDAGAVDRRPADRDRGFSFEAFIARKFKSNSFAHRGARVIDTDTLLRISLVLRVSSDGQEHEQDSEDNPNVNAHQGITVELNAARTLALSRELCRVLSGRGLEIRPWPSRLVPPRAP